MDTLKSMIFPLVLCGIIALGVWAIVTFQSAPEEEEFIQVYSYEDVGDKVVMENDSLIFTMDPTTTQFVVKDKSSGQMWSSNPDGAADDPLALPEERNNLQSTLIMSYAITSGLEVTYNTNAYSINNSIYSIEKGDNSITVNYSLGKVEREYIIPTVLTKDAFDSWTGKMDSKSATLVKEYFKKYNPSKLKDEKEKEELLGRFPLLEDGTIYALRDTVKENMKKQIEQIFEEVGYTYEDYVVDKENDLSTATSDAPIFNVTVEYILDGDDLVVKLPMNKMEYKKHYPMYTITPLPYFGSAGTNEKGYMFVPEGGGAIINFNNGKTAQNAYYVNEYGWDMCITRDAVVHNTESYFNTFGVSKDKGSFLCILEEGKSYAAIQADISGKNNSYNYVNAKFSLNQREKYDVGEIANSDIYEYTQSLPDEDIVLRYKLIDSTSYVDMAKVYGQYLKDNYGSYLTLNEDTEAPIAIEVVGAVDKVKQIVGIPVSRPLPLTTFDEASSLITQLDSDGLNNMSVKLSGWCNGGVKQKYLSKAKPISSLGGKSGLNRFVNTANSLGVDLYLNGITQYANQSSLLDGFLSYRDAAKLISKERAELYPYSVVTFAQREWSDTYWLLHTDLGLKATDTLAKSANKYNVGISLQETGDDLSADYYRKNLKTREDVRGLQSEQLKSLDDSNMKIMINKGNDYAVPYVDFVTNMDLEGSRYTILDETVPFYQLAVHGYVNYSGEALNLCGNEQEELLRCAEYGAGLYYTIMNDSAFALQKTLYTEYYGSSFNDVHQRIVDTYNRYNSELGHIFNQEMVGHDNLTSDVSCTEYADGTKVYVNYGYENVSVDGVNVPARDYLVKR